MWHFDKQTSLNDYFTSNYHRNTDWARVPGVFTIGAGFNGAVDNLVILNRQVRSMRIVYRECVFWRC
jgi:hypothetical protein